MGIFDRDEMVERLGDDEEFMRMVLDIFMGDVGNQLDKLKEAIATGDAGQIHAQGHTLKGASSNVSANNMRDISLEIEMAGKDGTIDNVAKLMEDLLVEYEKFAAELTSQGLVKTS